VSKISKLKISFAHHLSLSYFGGGEKWIISTVKELAKRGHNVEIFALPFLLDGKPKIKPKEVLEDIPYTEGLHHNIKADVVYVTYNPLSWLNFKTSIPRIAGIHAHSYWQKIHPNYGVLPNVANIVNKFTSYFELRRFNAIHTVTNVYPINHPVVYVIPNFVDSEFFKPINRRSEDFTISFASRMVWQKGWDVYNNIKKKLKKEIQFKETLGLVPESDLPNFLGSSHLTLVPSRVDTFGLSIVESMLSGTPVLTSPLETHKVLNLPVFYASTIDEYIKNIHSIRNLWEDKLEYDYLAKRCRETALKFDKMYIVDQLEKMFIEVVENS